MANIRVLARAIGGIALSVSIASVTASVVVQEYRIKQVARPANVLVISDISVFPVEKPSIKQVARPATIPIISSIFPVPLIPMLPESVFTLENAITLTNFSREIVDTLLLEETINLSVAYNRELSDDLGVLEADRRSVGKFATDQIHTSETATKLVIAAPVDSVMCIEFVALNASRLLLTSAIAVDTPTNTVGKTISDTAGITESIAVAAGYVRSFASGVVVFESLTAIGKDKIVEVTTTTDFEINFDTGKVLFDATNSVEFAEFNLGKSPTDSAAATETIVTAADYGRAFEDTANTVEIVTANVTKQNVDSVAILESSLYVTNKNITDVSFADENIVCSTNKSLTDVTTTIDSPNIFVSYDRVFVDNVNVIESVSAFGAGKTIEIVASTDFVISKQAAKSAIDSSVATEASTNSISKPVTSSTASVEFVELSLGKPLSNSAAATENAFAGFTKPFFDAISSGDTPVISTGYNRLLTSNASTAENSFRDLLKLSADIVTTSEDPVFSTSKSLQSSATVGESIFLNVISVDRADINRLPLNVGMINGPILELKPSNGALNGIEINGLILNESTQES